MEQTETLRKIIKKSVDEADDTFLELLLQNAEQDICLHLNTETLDGRFNSSVLELAAIRFGAYEVRARGIKAQTYTEKDLSESTTFLTSDEYKAQEDALFQKLNRYRVVGRNVQ